MKILRFFKGRQPKESAIFAIEKCVAIVVTTMIFTINVSCGEAFAQKPYDEVGIFLGGGYYNGEINPSKPFYKVQPAIGLNLRHGLNDRFAITFQAVRCVLKGDDADFSNEYQKQRAASFENEIIELSLQGEFNFFTLKKASDDQFVTPYAALGPGLIVGAFPGEGLQFCIPFGLGVKFCPKQKFTVSVEWKYRKTFTDMVDQIYEDQYDPRFGLNRCKQRSFAFNKDWYSFVGVVLSYQIFGGDGSDCRAYN